MEETMEAPRSHRSLSPAMFESSRSGRDCGNDTKPLSPLPARGASYADQCNEASDVSKTVLDASDRDPMAKMRNFAKFLQGTPDRERDYMSDPETMRALDRYAKSNNWRNFGQEHLLPARFSPKQRDLSSPKNGGGYASDGYSSEGTKEDSAPQELPNGYRNGRSPNTNGMNFEAADSIDDAAIDAKRRFFQNYLKSGGYELDNQEYQKYHQSTDGSTRVPAEDNPLAAMLQKFAVGDRFCVSPLKNVVPISASLYAGKGLPKKRRYRNDVVFPAAIPSYGLPSVNGSGGIMGQSGKERSANDHPDVFICHICSFVATSNEDFKSHMTIHYDYQCPQCTYSSRTEGRLKHHIKYFHESASMDHPGDEEAQDSSRQFQKTNQPKKFRCRQCHFISYSREEHWDHISVHIKKEKQLKCIHCPFVTEFKHHLEYHIRNHNNSKPYKCNKCNYTCVNKSMLNSHMKSHTNVYQFRCASCKYATKYSHSLKLHLINKRHLPAVVLNPDGSLPTDGSGSFDLISKRGPPRGPRGPRKSKMATNDDDLSPPVLLPIFPTSTSSMMSFGHASEYPWIPAPQTNGKPPNGVANLGGTTLSVPPVNGTLRTSAMPDQSLGYPLSILSQMSNSVASSSVISYPVVSTSALASVPCGFCPATFSSLTVLADHVRLEHAVRLGGCGVKLETTSPTQEQPTSGNVRERGVGEIQMKRNSVSGEIPLDLSSKNSDVAKPTSLKRSAVHDDEDSRCNVSPSSSAAISRKRSRKGKACKLDELSLKLQDHWKEEDGLLEGSESSSMDDEFHSGLRGGGGGGSGVVGKESGSLEETERKFYEVGCGSLSPLGDNNGVRRKELTQYSDADSSDQHHDSGRKSVESSKPVEFLDKEHGSDDGNTVTSHAKRGSPARKTPENGYYTCNHCDMGFRDNVTHFLHMGYHTYDDPFKCNKCGHRSANAIDFFVHMARVAHAQ